MSMHNHIFVGPYLLGKYHLIDFISPVYGCPKCLDVEFKSSTKFCAKCGTLITYYDKPKKYKSVNFHELVGDDFMDLGETSVPECVDILIPNENRNAPRKFCFEIEGILDSSDFDIEKEKQWISEAFKEEVYKLRDAYDSLEIKWGVLSSLY